ncbi:MAG: hypothetical protein EOP83_03490 [Verrucomicrobiaceae bacterium]|nr:MAG: hypothetical protein EOP83_03490 [Verrucomicrobiaceae bacterium]
MKGYLLTPWAKPGKDKKTKLPAPGPYMLCSVEFLGENRYRFTGTDIAVDSRESVLERCAAEGIPTWPHPLTPDTCTFVQVGVDW